jgi:hypothetical protein
VALYANVFKLVVIAMFERADYEGAIEMGKNDRHNVPRYRDARASTA